MDIDASIKNYINQLLDKNPIRGFSAKVFRAVWSDQWVVCCARKPGRWHDQSRALYTSCEYDGAMAEASFYSMLKTNPAFSKASITTEKKSPLVFELEIQIDLAVRINLQDLEILGQDATAFYNKTELKRPNHKLCCQKVGDIAADLGLSGLFIPSARWDCENLVLFPHNLNSENCFVREDKFTHQNQDSLLHGWAESRGIKYS